MINVVNRNKIENKHSAGHKRESDFSICSRTGNNAIMPGESMAAGVKVLNINSSNRNFTTFLRSFGSTLFMVILKLSIVFCVIRWNKRKGILYKQFRNDCATIHTRVPLQVLHHSAGSTCEQCLAYHSQIVGWKTIQNFTTVCHLKSRRESENRASILPI